ncbi:MAG TPA: hypothetical protein VF797_09195 [Noviherbaspirillum sp.]
MVHSKGKLDGKSNGYFNCNGKVQSRKGTTPCQLATSPHSFTLIPGEPF